MKAPSSVAASAGWLPPRISSRDAGMSGKDITIYEAGDRLGWRVLVGRRRGDRLHRADRRRL